jgi:hypothetical protein
VLRSAAPHPAPPTPSCLPAGIQKEEREEVLQEEREHVVYIKRQDDGLCRRFEWW